MSSIFKEQAQWFPIRRPRADMGWTWVTRRRWLFINHSISIICPALLATRTRHTAGDSTAKLSLPGPPQQTEHFLCQPDLKAGCGGQRSRALAPGPQDRMRLASQLELPLLSRGMQGHTGLLQGWSAITGAATFCKGQPSQGCQSAAHMVPEGVV